MSCIHNENLKENIMNEILEMNVLTLSMSCMKRKEETIKVDEQLQN